MENTEVRKGLNEADRSALVRFLCGSDDPRAFEHVRSTLYWTLRDRGLPHEIAEDAIQEAMLRATKWCFKGRLADVEKPSEWFRTTVLNAAWSLARRRRDKTPGSMPDVAADPVAEMDDTDEKRVQAAAVRSALSRIPPKLRDGLLDYIDGDMSIRALADSKGLPESTMRGRISRGCRAVQDQLGTDVVEIPAPEIGAPRPLRESICQRKTQCVDERHSSVSNLKSHDNIVRRQQEVAEYERDSA